MFSDISKTIIAAAIALIFINGKNITAQPGTEYKWYAKANLGI